MPRFDKWKELGAFASLLALAGCGDDESEQVRSDADAEEVADTAVEVTDSDVNPDISDAADTEGELSEDAGLDAAAEAESDAESGDSTEVEADGGPRSTARAAVPIAGANRGLVAITGESSTAPSFGAEYLVPEMPGMASGGRSNIHNDAWMTDTYAHRGPEGRAPEVFSSDLGGLCGTITFDSRGNIFTVCIGLGAVRAFLLDSASLDVLASYDLPPRVVAPGGTFTSFGGGGYFYLDDADRAFIATSEREVIVLEATTVDGVLVLQASREIDLSGVIPADDVLYSTLPDSDGNLWFISGAGIVGAVRADGTPVAFDTREKIANSFAVDPLGGVLVVTERALYRFDLAGENIQTTWEYEYQNDGVQKPGQVSAGSGTTPTIVDGNLVAITDNSDPINVVVVEQTGGSVREVCAVPVFEQGASATDNSLIGIGRSLFVENNYGYVGPEVARGPQTVPGFARVDVLLERDGCVPVWTNATVMSPSVVPKLSRASGLIYAYTRQADDLSHRWAFTALRADTGTEEFSVPVGDNLLLNNNYAGLAIGADGSAYLGVLGGIVGFRDTAP